MTAKKMWGCILIVLGVLAIVSGVDAYFSMNLLDNAMNSLPFKYSGIQSFDTLLYQSQKQYAEASRYARVMSVIRVLAGIALSVWGTMLMREEDKSTQVEPPKHYRSEENKYDGWKM